jgi:hypothetical protein
MNLAEAIAEARRRGGFAPFVEGALTGEVDARASVRGLKREWKLPPWLKELGGKFSSLGANKQALGRAAIRGVSTMVGGMVGYRIGARYTQMVRGAVVGVAVGQALSEVLIGMVDTRAQKKALAKEKVVDAAPTRPAVLPPRTGPGSVFNAPVPPQPSASELPRLSQPRPVAVRSSNQGASVV